MNLFIYSDESGVFDKAHNDYFVFAGVIFGSKETKENAARKYLKAERTLREHRTFEQGTELKASKVSNKDKAKLYRSLNQLQKFGVIIRQEDVLNSIFSAKKSKQRYLDYAFKIAVKKKFEHMIRMRMLNPLDVDALYFFVDEHTTATDGRYELRESLEQEFRWGTYNHNYSLYFPPIFPNLKTVDVRYCDSKTVTLVRAADIVANRLYFIANKQGKVCNLCEPRFNIIWLP